MRRIPRLAMALVLGAMLAHGAGTSAHAQQRAGAGEPSDAEKKKLAGREFREGVKAFKKGQFAQAAEHFEKANEIAPNDKALWNAAESREKAGELPRSARLYQRFLDIAPAQHKDRPEALSRLANIAALIGRLELVGQDATSVTVDGEEADQGAVVYVDPGDHVVRATLVDGRVITRAVSVRGGTLVKVALEAPREAAPAVTEETPVPDEPVGEKKSGWSPTVFYVGAALTGALGAASVVSGLDTQSKRRAFDANPTARGYDDGVAAQKRTNLLLGATAVVGVATGAIGLFAVRWSGGEEASVAVAPSDVRVSVRF